MGCCNNKKDCNRQQNKEEFNVFSDTALPIINGLTEIFKTGIPVLFKNTAVDQLASKIAALVCENRYLKALVELTSSASVDIETEQHAVKITFGQDGVYQLIVPTKNKADRQSLIKSFQTAVADLAAFDAESDKQLPLF